VSAEIRLYDRLFTVPEPDADKEVDFCKYLNPASLVILQGWVESGVQDALPESRYQFERLGYFCTDRRDHKPGVKLVFNRTVTLRDSYPAGASKKPGGISFPYGRVRRVTPP
jgi:glutaminyl-tRNA synthetase